MKKQSNLTGRTVYIVDGCRTPFLKAKGIGPFTGSDLAVQAGRSLLNRQPIDSSMLSEVIIGCAMPSPDEANIARVVALRLGCGNQVPAFTVMRNCASGLQALDNAAMQIASGRSELVLAGGTDAMSHAPLLFSQKMAGWLAQWSMAKSMGTRFHLITQLKLSYLAPVVALLRGLTDPVVGLNMGQTAEQVAYRFGLTRKEMDEFACQSHLRSVDGYANNHFSEVTPIIDSKGKVYEKDDGIRPDSSVEHLTKLKPYFDKKYGMVTPGNSSQITDGACLLLLASGDAVKKHKLKVIGKIVDTQWAALDPAQMGLGPVHAATPILERQKLHLDDIDCWEINEAFAAQVLGCVAAWQDESYCKEQLHLKAPMGRLDASKLNKDGGAIALGHPIGASGARIILHVLKSLEATNESRGMASICIGGGQGGAMYLERVTEVSEHE
jgi:acetyl-CoA C-acetyltransferase